MNRTDTGTAGGRRRPAARRLASLTAAIALAAGTLAGTAGTVTAASTWTTLSTSATDVWADSLITISATTPDDTDELCAIFINGEVGGNLAWADFDRAGIWNVERRADSLGIVPFGGAYVLDIRCYATTLTDNGDAPKAWTDAYVTGVTIAWHDGARLDTFEPASAAPVATITWVPQQAFQPAYTDSSFGAGMGGVATAHLGSDYKVEVDIAEANGAGDVATVSICLHESGHEDECAATSPDPRYAMVMTWTRPVGSNSTEGTDGFAIAGDNNYAENGAAESMVSDWTDTDDFHTTVRYWFDVSDAMHAGDDWYVTAVAANTIGQTGSDSMITSGVSYFAWVTTPRTPLDYGSLDVGESASKTGSLGTFIANDSSAIYLQAEDFTYEGASGSATMSLATGQAGDTVGSGEVGLDCAKGSSIGDGGAARIGTLPIPVVGGQFATGTGEAGDSTLEATCRLTFGGGAAISKVQYTATIWVGIGPSMGDPYAGGRPGSDPAYVVFAP